jgi:ubiquitin-like-conjugating enzyme ATG3
MYTHRVISAHSAYIVAHTRCIIIVPCLKRAKDMAYAGDDEREVLASLTNDDTEEGDGWLATHVDRGLEQKVDADDAIRDIDDIYDERSADAVIENDLTVKVQNISVKDTADIPEIDDDLDGFDDCAIEEEDDPATLGTTGTGGGKDTDNIIRTRTYDISITYDKYYQTPRVWLFGYDEHRRPLSAAQIFEDISQEHAHKTVTIDPHPHMDISMASVHPCRHADVMKRIIERAAASGTELRVDYYMVIFLKFLSVILPTIDYDYTMAMEG